MNELVELEIMFYSRLFPRYDETIKQELSIEEITKAVCKITSINEEAIFGRTRKREIVEGRQIVQYLTKILTTRSLDNIGKNTGGFDHATVLHSYKTINGFVAQYKDWRLLINKIIAKLP